LSQAGPHAPLPMVGNVTFDSDLKGQINATVAPMVEQRTENSCVAGSSPACGTKVIRRGSRLVMHRIVYPFHASSILVHGAKFFSV
jgi:hypothetical protein